ncbi:pimeloyl-ACP methyl ester carboxylesterase [Alicyclobacillus sacchari]|uniref:Pimeloyl-ACP methyl ester carboxylesterase n=1 Tax=Alicyclobacillus sacchari TaxID=392010 RepID=A0A4V3HF35_9BACL|nr:alpha/beta hydrolase [Alicyclobacillus sacchari]TDY51321.1 pimeloyl-ACP methyl ester carboxylesterase [Alicyclobacillus sacchari]GMA56624.1 hydrolase [Alicyclobacillus sacchari]
MPLADLGAVELYYEVHGEGQPLILIMGLGGNADWWGSGFVRRLAAKRQLIVFDNRGAARTVLRGDKPFTLVDMAEDVVGLMKHLGLAMADVFGVSMGGMVAQEVALHHPGHVRKLILGCTTCGGKEQTPPTAEAAAMLVGQPGDAGQELQNQIRLLFPDAFIAENLPLLENSFRALMRHPMPRENYFRQLHAIQTWPGTYDRLPAITHETLVLHGTDDMLIPVENGRTLHRRLPNSILREYPGTGHGFTLQAASDVLADVESFLEA